MSLSPQWSLIHSILQNGPDGLHYVLGRGIVPEHLGDSDEKNVLDFLLGHISSERLPTIHEIKLATDIEAPDYDNPLDLTICADKIIKGAVRNQMLDKLGQWQNTLLNDPLQFRENLYELFHSTGWVKGKAVDSTANPASITEVMEAYEVAKNMRGKGIIGLSSPWPSFDARSRGLQVGQLTVLVAKRAVGKSQLSLVWLNHVWKHDLSPDDKILFVSMEMDRLMVKRRLFSIAARLDYTRFNEGRLTAGEEKNFYNFCNKLITPTVKGTPEVIFLYSDEINSVTDIEVKVAEHKPKLVIVDGLYIIGRGSKKSRWERTVDTVEELKLRVALNYPTIAIHQLKGTTKENTMSADADEMAYAKAIADYADVILGIFADDGHRRGRQRTVRTLKGRDFIPIDWRINFDLENQDYSEIDVIEDDEPPALSDRDDSSDGSSKNFNVEGNAGGRVFGSGSEISI